MVYNLYYCCYAKNSSPEVQKRHSKVYGNPIQFSLIPCISPVIYYRFEIQFFFVFATLEAWWKERISTSFRASIDPLLGLSTIDQPIDPSLGLSTLDQPIDPLLRLSTLDQLSSIYWDYQP